MNTTFPVMFATKHPSQSENTDRVDDPGADRQKQQNRRKRSVTRMCDERTDPAAHRDVNRTTFESGFCQPDASTFPDLALGISTRTILDPR